MKGLKKRTNARTLSLGINQAQEVAMSAVRKEEYSTERKLYVAFELGQSEWKLGFGIGLGRSTRRRSMTARDLVVLEAEIHSAKERLGLPYDASVYSCYEAGLDGFWLHRYLTAHHVVNLVVDSASIEVNRRSKQTKTDRLDVEKLLRMLIRYHNGEPEVWHVVRVPSEAAEDHRHLHRQLINFKHDRNRHRSRIRCLLGTQGVQVKLGKDFSEGVKKACCWDGQPLPLGLQQRALREFAQLQAVERQIQELEAERAELIASDDSPEVEKVRQLMLLRGIGPNIAWLLVMEFFAWRDFKNRRQVGGLAGLTPTPYQSGSSYREQGISKAGNRWVRAMAVELAWCWVRWQPDSALTQWYRERYGKAGKRHRKVGIVAVARKLLVALWQYLETGVIPQDAVLKATS